ncbi:MAG: homoserine kinase [Desulfovibrio sp.]
MSDNRINPFPVTHQKEEDALVRCVTLVGIAGAGKTTLGMPLAEALGWEVLDTDKLIESCYGIELQDVLDTYGLDKFLEIEEEIVASLRANRTVISTGGSVIYGKKAIARLKELGPVIHLDVDKESFFNRVGNAEGRGLAIGEKSMEELFDERQPLYRAAADFTVRTDAHTPEENVKQILLWMAEQE